VPPRRSRGGSSWRINASLLQNVRRAANAVHAGQRSAAFSLLTSDRGWSQTAQQCNVIHMPNATLLETFPNPYPDRSYEIRMECHEFTSLCPLGGVESDAAELELLKGGAPDFGTIYITYVPGDLCIELKSLKLYLWSFRDAAVFYERAVNRILDDLSAAMSPRWIQVVGDFNVRGGIKSVISVSQGTRPG
jgi:7-cyano-7-deazaguanine reductase